MTAPAPPAPGHERRHRPPADQPGWSEAFTWETAPDGDHPAVSIRLVLLPDRAWYLAAVAVPGRPLAVVTDLDVPLPSWPTLEVRASGLWADHNVETPFAHVSVGLEAFGLVLDDPADALADGYGDRTPVGFDLEWEDDRPPVTGLADAHDRYEVIGSAHGEILLGADAFEVDGPGQREHAWGPLDWAAGWWRASIRWDDGRHTVARGPGPGGTATGRPGGTTTAGRSITVRTSSGTGTAVPAGLDLRWDDWGLPVGARLRLGTSTWVVEPAACIPVPLTGAGAGAAGGGTAILSAPVTCHDREGAGPAGRGWLEVVGPLPD